MNSVVLQLVDTDWDESVKKYKIPKKREAYVKSKFFQHQQKVGEKKLEDQRELVHQAFLEREEAAMASKAKREVYYQNRKEKRRLASVNKRIQKELNIPPKD